MKALFRTVLLVAVLSALPVVAQGQGAACTGWCYVSGSMPSCGFTALQEGGVCSVQFDLWYGWICTIRACSGGPGDWEPENQGSLVPRLPEGVIVEPEIPWHKVTVTVLDPRT